MMWLQPWAAWLLAGLPVIVLLYLLKVRRRPVSVSTLMFWQKVMQEHRRRALFQRLRSVLSLLLHLLIFALIVAAIGRPTLDRLVREGASTVIIIDQRARMNARDASGRTRFENAIQEAIALVRDASSTRQFAVLTGGIHTQTVSPFSPNERELKSALAALQPTDAGGDLDESLKLADALLATRHGAKQMVLLTDRPLPKDVADQFPTLQVRALGAPLDNVGIVRFAARPMPASPTTSEILLELANFGAAPVSTSVELKYDDRLVDVRPITLQPGQEETMIFPSIPRPGAAARGELVGRLQSSDAFPTDDSARVWLPPPRPIRTLLISTGNVFVEKALAADPGVSYELLGPESWSQELGSKFDVVVFDSFVPEPAPPGSVLYFGKSPFGASDQTLKLPPITEIDSSHPTLRLIDFSQTTVLRANPQKIPPPSDEWTYTAPLRSFDHALLVIGEKHGAKPTRVAAFGIDLAATDLPLRIAFPLLITNTVHWLAGVSSESPSSLRAGEMIWSNPGEESNAAAAAARAPLRNGFYPVTRAGRSEWIAVNTFDRSESDFRFTADPAQRAIPGVPLPGTIAGIFSGWPLWRYLAMGALLLFTAEWALFHRRRTE